MKRLLIGMIALVLVFSTTACGGGSQDRELEATMPASSRSYVGEHFELAVEELKDAGFTNVQTNALGDLVTGWLKSDGDVEKIRINGSNSFSKGAKFPVDTKIVITYHSFPEKAEKAPAESPEPEPIETVPTDAERSVPEEEAPVAIPEPEPEPEPDPEPVPEPEQTGPTDAERSVVLEQRLKEIFGGVESMSELLLEMPAEWPGYVVGVRVEDHLAYFTLQVDRNSPDGKRLGEDAARALSTLLSKNDVEGISWLIVEDGTGVVIDQNQPSPIN